MSKSQKNPVTKPKRKIAIIGTAPQWQLAPFDDPEWEIWGIYGVACAGKRLTRLYEVHKPEEIVPMVAKQFPDGRYWKVANDLGSSYISQHVYEQTPNATKFDFESKLKKYGPHFGCSISWLIADAIDEGVDEIGIWGVNMCSTEEYAGQKPSASYMLGWARACGIQVTIPSSSELLAFAYQYAYENEPRWLQTLAQKRHEIECQLAAHKQNLEGAKLNAFACEREIALLDHLKQNWKV